MHIYSCIILFYAVGLVSSAFTKGDVTISCKNSVCIKEGKLVADTKDNKTLVFSIANEDFVSINIKFNGIRLVRMAGNVKGVQVFPNQSHPDRSRFIIQKDPYVSADKTEFKCIFQMLHFTLVDTGKIFKYEVRYLNGGDDGEMLISVNEKSGKSTSTLDESAGLIVGIVIAIIIFVIIAVIFILCKKGLLSSPAICPSDCCDDPPKKSVETKPKVAEYEEGEYAPLNITGCAIKEPLSGDQIVYSELGPGGGRVGPKPLPYASNYAQVKNEDEYHKRGPSPEDDEVVV